MTPSTQPIRFFHRGADRRRSSRRRPTRTVLDWLREDARCTGTKEGCAEGDCGACTVVLGELAPASGRAGGCARASTPASSSCRRSTARRCSRSRTCAAATATLHPVQQAMVECHGSQCGFCTPGFVMSLWATLPAPRERGTQPTRQQLADDLSGNLCRCTGYRPILDAGAAHVRAAAPCGSTPRRSVAALRALQRDAAGIASASRARRRLPSRRARSTSWPRCASASATRSSWPARTDVGLWVTKQFRDAAAT